MGGLRREEGRRRTRVLDRTFCKRGKSLMPESRMEMEESRRVRELRSEATEAEREVRDWDCADIVGVVVTASDVDDVVFGKGALRCVEVDEPIRCRNW